MALHIDYYVSLNSPWTHLGAARIEAMAMAQQRHPADLSGRFRHHLRRSPAACRCRSASPQRQAYRLMELRRWRDHLGIPINIQPKFFPASEQLSAGCVIALRETHGRPAGDQAGASRAEGAVAGGEEPRRSRHPGRADQRCRPRCRRGDEAGRRAALGGAAHWPTPRRRWIAACSARPAMSSATRSSGARTGCEFVERRLARG